jgi:hypothetical protein
MTPRMVFLTRDIFDRILLPAAKQKLPVKVRFSDTTGHGYLEAKIGSRQRRVRAQNTVTEPDDVGGAVWVDPLALIEQIGSFRGGDGFVFRSVVIVIVLGEGHLITLAGPMSLETGYIRGEWIRVPPVEAPARRRTRCGGSRRTGS